MKISSMPLPLIIKKKLSLFTYHMLHCSNVRYIDNYADTDYFYHNKKVEHLMPADINVGFSMICNDTCINDIIQQLVCLL